MRVDLNPSNRPVYRFDVYRVDSSTRRVFGPDDEVIPLMPKAYEILLYLVTNSGRVIEKDELMTAVWPDTAVEENNLTQNISAIRRALGERLRENRFIATVPGRGYEFVAQVTVEEYPLEPPESDHDENNEDHGSGKVSPRSPSATPGIYRRGAIALAAVLVIGLASIGFFFWNKGGDQTGARISSLAVLPFKPLVAGSRDEAFEMGIADTLIRKLSGEQLNVRPLTSVRRFASPEQDSADAGRQLGVEAVLDGAIMIVDGRVRVSAELIRVSDGRRLWTGQFDDDLTDIFKVQDSISERVASALRISLADRSKLPSTVSVEAYQLYMKGELHAKRLILPELQKGIAFYEQAIAADPSYALAYVGLANAYRSMVLTNDASPHEMMPKARSVASRSVEIDSNLAEAWTALAISEFWYEWNWNAAEEHLRRALELDPRNPPTHASYAHLLSNLGRHDEALGSIKRALELDPSNPLLNAMEGQILCLAGRQSESTNRLRATIDLDPNFWLPHLFISRNYIIDQNWDAAIASATRAKDMTNGNSEATATIGYALALSGRKDEAREVLSYLLSPSLSTPTPSYSTAIIYLGLGDRERAMEALEAAYQQRYPLLVFLKVEPKWNDLRSEPRFIKLMERMKF